MTDSGHQLQGVIQADWDDSVRDFALHLRARNLSPATIRIYTTAARDFGRWIIARPMPVSPWDATTRDVQAWIVTLLESGRRGAAGNANTNYRSLQQYCKWLTEEMAAETGMTNPMIGLSPPVVPERAVPVVPDAVLRRVVAHWEGGRDFRSVRNAAIIRLIFDSGARLSAVARLALDDVNQDDREISVVEKGRRPLVVPYGVKTAKALNRYIRLRRQQDWAHIPNLWLCSLNKGPLYANGIKIMLRETGRASGVNEEIGRNLHAHLGRHWSAAKHKASGMSDSDMKRRFGWKSGAMVDRYGRAVADEQARHRSKEIAVGDQI